MGCNAGLNIHGHGLAKILKSLHFPWQRLLWLKKVTKLQKILLVHTPFAFLAVADCTPFTLAVAVCT